MRARANQLTPDEVRGGTFTITNPGGYGSIMATPVINLPQVGILDTEAVVKRPVVVTDELGNDSIAIRRMTYLCMSWDHRAPRRRATPRSSSPRCARSWRPGRSARPHGLTDTRPGSRSGRDRLKRPGDAVSYEGWNSGSATSAGSSTARRRRCRSACASGCIAGELPDLMLLLEHPPVYTLGRRSEAGDLPFGEAFYRDARASTSCAPRAAAS